MKTEISSSFSQCVCHPSTFLHSGCPSKSARTATRREEWERNIFLFVFLLIAFLVFFFVFTIGLHQGPQSVVQFIHKDTSVSCPIVPSFLAVLSSTCSPVAFPLAWSVRVEEQCCKQQWKVWGQQAFSRPLIQIVPRELSCGFFVWLLWANRWYSDSKNLSCKITSRWKKSYRGRGLSSSRCERDLWPSKVNFYILCSYGRSGVGGCEGKIQCQLRLAEGTSKEQSQDCN